MLDSVEPDQTGDAGMRIRGGFRHRAGRTESIELRHAELVRKLKNPMVAWLGDYDPRAIHFESETVDSGAVDLSRALRADVSAAISYCSRSVIDADHAMYDDVLTLEFSAADADYSTFAQPVFGQLAEIFDAYRGSVVLDEDLDLADYDQILDKVETSGRDVDGRDGVYRISPVCFFDRELCSRAFGIAPEEIFGRLRGKIEHVEITHDGVLIVATREILTKASLVSLDREIRDFLDIA
jgi:hypothetical protein